MDRGHTLAGTPPEDFPPNGLGDTFTLSEDEPVTLRLMIQGCDDYVYDFGLDITYQVNNRTYILPLGSADNPYQIIGSDAQSLYASSGEPGSGQVISTTTEDFEQPGC